MLGSDRMQQEDLENPATADSGSCDICSGPLNDLTSDSPSDEVGNPVSNSIDNPISDNVNNEPEIVAVSDPTSNPVNDTAVGDFNDSPFSASPEERYNGETEPNSSLPHSMEIGGYLDLHVSFNATKTDADLSGQWIYELLARYGDIKHFTLMKAPSVNMFNGSVFGYGFAAYDDLQEALKTIRQLKNQTIGHVTFDCHISHRSMSKLSSEEVTSVKDVLAKIDEHNRFHTKSNKDSAKISTSLGHRYNEISRGNGDENSNTTALSVLRHPNTMPAESFTVPDHISSALPYPSVMPHNPMLPQFIPIYPSGPLVPPPPPQTSVWYSPTPMVMPSQAAPAPPPYLELHSYGTSPLVQQLPGHAPPMYYYSLPPQPAMTPEHIQQPQQHHLYQQQPFQQLQQLPQQIPLVPVTYQQQHQQPLSAMVAGGRQVTYTRSSNTPMVLSQDPSGGVSDSSQHQQYFYHSVPAGHVLTPQQGAYANPQPYYSPMVASVVPSTSMPPWQPSTFPHQHQPPIGLAPGIYDHGEGHRPRQATHDPSAYQARRPRERHDFSKQASSHKK